MRSGVTSRTAQSNGSRRRSGEMVVMFIARPTERQADGKPKPHWRSEWDCRKHRLQFKGYLTGVFRLAATQKREAITPWEKIGGI